MHIKTVYKGQLRTKATHVKSGNTVLTDAPTDNNGKGETFSPTDMVAAALTSCMMTIMGIEANKLNLSLDGLSATTEKIMSATPRKVSKIRVKISWEQPVGTDEQKKHLKEKALSCPVALSLSEKLVQDISFDF
jgi:putative redox protein